jgi:parallel beta-helix repeat protein
LGERKKALILLLILVSSAISITEIKVAEADSRILIVPDDYPTIASALGNAKDGDTVFVKKGTYDGPINQSLLINKTISLIGENANSTIIRLYPDFFEAFVMGQSIGWIWGSSLVTTAQNVLISGFTFVSDGGRMCIVVDNAKIVGNIIAAPLSMQGYNQTLAFNNLTANVDYIGDYGKVYENNAKDCGVFVSYGSKTCIFNNMVLGGGIGTGGTSRNIIIYNNTVNDGSQISLANSGNIVANNTISNSSMGVAIMWGGDNRISGNVVTNCKIGLYKTEPHGGNIFSANYVANNSCGVKIACHVESAETTLYHNNFINNVVQVNTDPTETIGGSGTREFTRSLIHSGLFDNGTEGNFWSDYTGEDNNKDNIGDTPYFIDENRRDNHPLMYPFDIYSDKIQLPDWANIEPTSITVPDIKYVDIHIDSPQNMTYANSVSLNFTVNEEASWMSYSLDGQDNVTVTETTLNLTELADGSHTLTVYAKDTDGNTAASETISLTIAKEDDTPIAQDDETPTTWTTTVIAIAAVAAAGAAITLYFTKTRKAAQKN